MKRYAILALVLAFAPGAYAWEDHSVPTALAISKMPEITQAPPVRVESLETFLSAEKKGVAELTDSEETWARAHVPAYPSRPAALAFDPESPLGVREAFLRSLRLNPTIRLGLYVQRLPGFPTPVLPDLACDKVTILAHCPGAMPNAFGALQEGQLASVFDVLATASDEPDYGHDIGLWHDSGTPFGNEYGFGKQPFGNPAYEFATQAPFHMGFYHEAKIIYDAAPFLKRTYPELRIHQFLTLARFAFQTGHPYWGWRFLGWGLHYIGDLTQPYHSTVLPGVGVAKMLFVNTLDLIGIHGPKNNQLELVSNRHLALENFELGALKFECERDPSRSSEVLSALTDPSSDPRIPYDDSYPRNVVSARSHAFAKMANRIVKSSLPRLLVRDPKYNFGVDLPVPDTREIIDSGDPQAKEQMYFLLNQLMHEFGIHTRAYIKAGLE